MHSGVKRRRFFVGRVRKLANDLRNTRTKSHIFARLLHRLLRYTVTVAKGCQMEEKDSYHGGPAVLTIIGIILAATSFVIIFIATCDMMIKYPSLVTNCYMGIFAGVIIILCGAAWGFVRGIVRKLK